MAHLHEYYNTKEISFHKFPDYKNYYMWANEIFNDITEIQNLI